MWHTGPHNPTRRGMTLLELLIVLTILVILLGVAIPAMRPALEGRQTREAARALNVYFGSARYRAKELGRPCGVVIKRYEGLPQCSMVLKQAEVPPPYSGDYEDSAVKLNDWTKGQFGDRDYWLDGATVVKVFVRASGIGASGTGAVRDFSPGLIRYGDLVQLNRQGPYYRIMWDEFGAPVPDFPEDEFGYLDFDPEEDPAADKNQDGWIDTHVLTLVLADARGQTVAWPTWREDTDGSEPVPFEIFRQPMSASTGDLQLPSGAVIDLEFSGTDNQAIIPGLGWPHSAEDEAQGVLAASSPVIIMFSPNGSVDRVIYYEHLRADGEPHEQDDITFQRREITLVDPLYLLVGKRERVPSEWGRENWRNTTNLWVALNPQSGLVTTAEVAAPEDEALGDFYESRDLVRKALSMGGR